MAEESGQDKTEEPTQHRIEEFRRKGQVAASKELSSVLILSVSILTLGISLLFIYEQIEEFMSWLWSLPVEKAYTEESLKKIFDKALVTGLKCAGPMFAVVFVFGIVSQIMQVGFLFSPEVLEAKFDKINPINGFKRLFSIKSIAEAIKGILKFTVILSIVYLVLKGKIFSFGGFLHSTPIQGFLYGKQLMLEVCYTIILGLVVIAAIDFAWEKFQYRKKLMQTKQQIKEESKEKEGNPEIKQKIRSIQREMASRRMMDEVPKADVIITNPTHISIAIKYDPATMIAPAVVAKGADHVAFQIRELAKKHDVPMVENVKLARTLYKTVKIGEGVPRELYKAVAEVLAFVYKMKKRIKELATGAAQR